MQKSQIVNWAAKMNDLSNTEIVNLTPNENGITFNYLENGDLFYSKALASRKGTVDLCGGVVNMAFRNNLLWSVTSGLSANSYEYFTTGLRQIADGITSYPVTVFIPSGDVSLVSGYVRISEYSIDPTYISGLGNQANYDIDIQAWVFALDQTPLATSGYSAMQIKGGVGNSGIHSIALSGTLGGPPWPQYASQTLPVPSGSCPIGVGVGRVNLGPITPGTPPLSESAWQNVSFNFNPPIFLNGNTAYAVRWVTALTSGTIPRTQAMWTITDSTIDISKNTRLEVEGQSTTQNYVVSGFQQRGVYPVEKTWLYGQMYSYVPTPFLDPDYYTASSDLQLPVKSGANGFSIAPFNVQPSAVYTADFGQIISPTGVQDYYGAYFWAGFKTPNGGLLKNGFDNTVFTSGKTYQIISSLSQILTSSGNINSGNYTVLTKQTLAQGSGNHLFQPNRGDSLAQIISGSTSPYQGPAFSLDKIYTLFDDAVTLSGSNYLLSFSIKDLNTGNNINDYLRLPIGFTGRYYSPIVVGTETQTPKPNYAPSGAFLMDYNGSGMFAQPSGIFTAALAPYTTTSYDLTCGLVTIPSGNEIVGIYDYRVGEDRSSKIMYGQAGDLRYFDLDSPAKENHVTINSGLSRTDNALLNFITYDDLLFTHQYSQITGICWNQVYPTTMPHGRRPTASYAYLTGVGPNIPSGVPFSLMVANNFDSGGFRTTEYQNISLSGSFASGFFAVSGLRGQYPFDVSANGSMYLFVTEPSGVNYYLANIYSGATTSSQLLNYPIPSGLDIVYIQRLANADTDQSFSAVTDLPQYYATSQVDTPKFKKMQVFFDYIVAIGDPDFPSRLWYSEQYAPQIWGESFDFHGFIDVDKDNGSPLTAMAKLREYTLLFKKNSTYRVEYLGNPSQPFSINQINSTIGSLGSFSTVAVGDTVYGLCQYGIFSTNGATVQIISDPIQPFFADLNHNDLTFSYALHDQDKMQIVWSISNDNANVDSNLGIMYNYKENSFSVRRNGLWNVAATVFDDDGFDVLLAGSNAGQIEQLEVGNSDDGLLLPQEGLINNPVPIKLYAETPWMSISDSQIQKQLRFLSFNADRVAGGQLIVEVYFNQDDTLRYRRTINLDRNSTDMRVNLDGKAKSVKFIFYNIGEPGLVKIKNLNIYYQDLGIYDPY